MPLFLITGAGTTSVASDVDHSTLVAAMIVSITISIILFFTFGCVCGCFCQKYKRLILALCKTSGPAAQPSIENSDSNVKTQDLEMTENVAYGPIQLITN